MIYLFSNLLPVFSSWSNKNRDFDSHSNCLTRESLSNSLSDNVLLSLRSSRNRNHGLVLHWAGEKARIRFSVTIPKLRKFEVI